MSRNSFSRRCAESGQAMLELTAMLVGLIAMMLGVIFIAGLALADNRTLLSAKVAAERGARVGIEPRTALTEVSGWHYTRTDVGPDSDLVTPFSAADYTVRSRLGSSVDNVQSAASGEIHSSENADYAYRWMSPRTFDTRFESDFTGSLSNAYNAADLVQGTGNSAIDPVSNFDSGYQENASGAMRNAFHEWFGIRINDTLLYTSPANQVYMPAAADTEQKESGL